MSGPDGPLITPASHQLTAGIKTLVKEEDFLRSPVTANFDAEVAAPAGIASSVVVAPNWQKRWSIVGLCGVAFMLCNMDRVNMSVAILPMSQQYLWDSETIGLVQSSFFW